MSLGRIGGVYALLHAAHHIADHWVQTNTQALGKGDPGWRGRRACAAHVAALALTQGAFLTAGALATGERISLRRAVLGLTINALSHYAADRREHGPLPHLAARAGKAAFYRLGNHTTAPTGTGAYALDQAWHTGWLALAATVIAHDSTRPAAKEATDA